MNGEVQRVLRHVIRDLRNQPRRETDNSPGNPSGSMPSDHIAAAAITAMALSEIDVAYGVLGWSYVVLASFAVVYLGEHYLIDVLAGLAVAQTVRLAEPFVSPFVRQLARVLPQIAGRTFDRLPDAKSSPSRARAPLRPRQGEHAPRENHHKHATTQRTIGKIHFRTVERRVTVEQPSPTRRLRLFAHFDRHHPIHRTSTTTPRTACPSTCRFSRSPAVNSGHPRHLGLGTHRSALALVSNLIAARPSKLAMPVRSRSPAP